MGKNWLLYLLGLAGSVVFHAYYFGWFSWFILVLAVCLPWFSLLVSLPAMVRVRLHLDAPASCMRGEPAYVTLRASNGFLPLPQCRFKLSVCAVMTGQTLVLKHESGSRAMLADGAVAAARFMAGKAVGFYNMESILNA